jgi:hypothetical protein
VGLLLHILLVAVESKDFLVEAMVQMELDGQILQIEVTAGEQ